MGGGGRARTVMGVCVCVYVSFLSTQNENLCPDFIFQGRYLYLENPLLEFHTELN